MSKWVDRTFRSYAFEIQTIRVAPSLEHARYDPFGVHKSIRLRTRSQGDNDRQAEGCIRLSMASNTVERPNTQRRPSMSLSHHFLADAASGVSDSQGLPWRADGIGHYNPMGSHGCTSVTGCRNDPSYHQCDAGMVGRRDEAELRDRG